MDHITDDYLQKVIDGEDTREAEMNLETSMDLELQ